MEEPWGRVLWFLVLISLWGLHNVCICVMFDPFIVILLTFLSLFNLAGVCELVAESDCVRPGSLATVICWLFFVFLLPLAHLHSFPIFLLDSGIGTLNALMGMMYSIIKLSKSQSLWMNILFVLHLIQKQ